MPTDFPWPEERPRFWWIPDRRRKVGRLPNGQEVVLVPLTNCAGWTVVYLDDYRRLMQMGISPNWNLNPTKGRYRYVMCPTVPDGSRSAPQAVARLIAEADGGHIVRYRDRNPLNLLSDNLRTCRK